MRLRVGLGPLCILVLGSRGGAGSNFSRLRGGPQAHGSRGQASWEPAGGGPARAVPGEQPGSPPDQEPSDPRPHPISWDSFCPQDMVSKSRPSADLEAGGQGHLRDKFSELPWLSAWSKALV